MSWYGCLGVYAWSPFCRMDSAMEEEWWRQFDLPSGERDLRPGVYRLIGLDDTVDSTPAVIHRACGDDATGTLYIGASSCLRDRIASWVMTNRPDIFRSAPSKPFAARLAVFFP